MGKVGFIGRVVGKVCDIGEICKAGNVVKVIKVDSVVVQVCIIGKVA